MKLPTPFRNFLWQKDVCCWRNHFADTISRSVTLECFTAALPRCFTCGCLSLPQVTLVWAWLWAPHVRSAPVAAAHKLQEQRLQQTATVSHGRCCEVLRRSQAQPIERVLSIWHYPELFMHTKHVGVNLTAAQAATLPLLLLPPLCAVTYPSHSLPPAKRNIASAAKLSTLAAASGPEAHPCFSCLCSLLSCASHSLPTRLREGYSHQHPVQSLPLRLLPAWRLGLLPVLPRTLLLRPRGRRWRNSYSEQHHPVRWSSRSRGLRSYAESTLTRSWSGILQS